MDLEDDPTAQSCRRLSATADRRTCQGCWPDAYALTNGEIVGVYSTVCSLALASSLSTVTSRCGSTLRGRGAGNSATRQ